MHVPLQALHHAGEGESAKRTAIRQHALAIVHALHHSGEARSSTHPDGGHSDCSGSTTRSRACNSRRMCGGRLGLPFLCCRGKCDHVCDHVCDHGLISGVWNVLALLLGSV